MQPKKKKKKHNNKQKISTNKIKQKMDKTQTAKVLKKCINIYTIYNFVFVYQSL